MRVVLTLGALISSATLAACGDVVVAEKSSGATGAGGATVTTSTTFTYPGVSASISSTESVGVTTPGVTGSGVGGASSVSTTQASSAGSSTAATTGAGGGGGGMCGNETHDVLTVVLTPPMGTGLGCSLETTPFFQGSVDQRLQGAITQTSSTTFSIDTCPPNADCSFSAWTLAVSTPLPVFHVTSGSFIDLHMTETLQGFGDCADAITIKNLPSWGSLPNPVTTSPLLLFAGADGAVVTVSDAPFTVSSQGLGCFPNDPNCGAPHDDYLLVFATPSSVQKVPMGQSVGWVMDEPTGNQFVVAHNLRSFSSGACDDIGQWGYWMEPGGIK